MNNTLKDYQVISLTQTYLKEIRKYESHIKENQYLYYSFTELVTLLEISTKIIIKKVKDQKP